MNTRLNNIRKIVAFLEFKGLDDLDWNFDSIYSSIASFSIAKDTLTDEEYRRLKEVFGPLKIRSAYEAKDEEGKFLFDDNFKLQVRISEAYTCKKAKPEEVEGWTDNQWDSYREKAKKGLVEIVNCEQVEVKNF